MWLPLAPRMPWVVRCHADGAGVAGARAVWRCSAAQRLRALGWFADAGWQDLRAVHDSRGPCSEKGPFLARSSRGVSSDGDLRGFSDTWRAHLAKASSFWMHGAQNLPRSPPFSSEAPFGIHGVKKLPRIAARERIRAQSCHRQAPGNAFHGHFAISERPQRHSTMTPCAVRGAFVAAEKVSCGLRVSMR